MLSVRRRAARSFTIALVSALWSCGHEAAHTGGVAFAHSESGAAPTPTARFVGRMRPLAPWVADLRRRIDSRADAWPSEIAAEAAEGALRPALEALFARCDASALLVLARGGAFEVAPLAPSALTLEFDDGTIRVARAEPEPTAAARDGDGAREELARLGARLAGASPVRVALACDLVEAPAPNVWTMEFAVRAIAGPDALGARREEAFRVRARWEALADQALALRSLARAGRFESVVVARPVLRAVTQAVFGADPTWGDVLLRGNGDDNLREDRLANTPILGMHGLAVGDADGDGLEDVYLPQPCGQANRLYRHEPDGTARDVAHAVHADFVDGSGPALFCDLDGDGDQDLLVGSRQHVYIAWNDGKGGFGQGQMLRGPDPAEVGTLAAADPDLDGDLDVFACRYVAGGMIGAAPAPYHDARNGATNLFWRNDGDRKFTECAKELGLEGDAPRFTLAALWLDDDEDGDPDLYVVNDFGRNQLLRNEGGRFHDVAAELGVEDPAAGMGIDVADVDLDGRLDLYVTNMHSPIGLRVARQERFLPTHPELRPEYVRQARGNTLLRALSDGRFEDATERAGVAAAGWGWGARFFDLQNDGLADLDAPNGFVSGPNRTDLAGYFWRCVIASTSMAPPPEPAYLNAWTALRHFTAFEGWSYAGNERKAAFLNLGGLAFVEAAGALGVDFLGDGRTALPLDWDDDGREDLLHRDRTAPRLRLLRNEHPAPNAWVAFELVGTRSNRDAIGARVRFRAGGVLRQAEVRTQAGFLCGASRRLRFGLGAAKELAELEVRWPGGRLERFEGAAPGARWRLVEGAGRAERVAPTPHPALASAPSDPPEFGPERALPIRPRDRVVLLDRLPIGALELPRYGGEARVDSLAGAPAVVVLADAGDALSVLAVEECAKRAARARVAFVLQGPSDARAALRARLRELGLEGCAGEADARFLEALQVYLIDVLGPFESLPLPLLLEIDAGGALAAFRTGSADADGALRDLAALGASTLRTTSELTPGRAVAGASRDLGAIAQVFDLLGRNDLARAAREKLKARGGQ